MPNTRYPSVACIIRGLLYHENQHKMFGTEEGSDVDAEYKTLHNAIVSQRTNEQFIKLTNDKAANSTFLSMKKDLNFHAWLVDFVGKGLFFVPSDLRVLTGVLEWYILMIQNQIHDIDENPLKQMVVKEGKLFFDNVHLKDLYPSPFTLSLAVALRATIPEGHPFHLQTKDLARVFELCNSCYVAKTEDLEGWTKWILSPFITEIELVQIKYNDPNNDYQKLLKYTAGDNSVIKDALNSMVELSDVDELTSAVLSIHSEHDDLRPLVDYTYDNQASVADKLLDEVCVNDISPAPSDSATKRNHPESVHQPQGSVFSTTVSATTTHDHIPTYGSFDINEINGISDKELTDNEEAYYTPTPKKSPTREDTSREVEIYIPTPKSQLLEAEETMEVEDCQSEQSQSLLTNLTPPQHSNGSKKHRSKKRPRSPSQSRSRSTSPKKLRVRSKSPKKRRSRSRSKSPKISEELIAIRTNRLLNKVVEIWYWKIVPCVPIKLNL